MAPVWAVRGVVERHERVPVPDGDAPPDGSVVAGSGVDAARGVSVGSDVGERVESDLPPVASPDDPAAARGQNEGQGQDGRQRRSALSHIVLLAVNARTLQALIIGRRAGRYVS